jgi:hypothetical protein
VIGLRVECDFPDCGRHFEVGAAELRPMGAVAVQHDRAAVLLTQPHVVFPEGWAVGEERGVVSVLCASHAPGAER